MINEEGPMTLEDKKKVVLDFFKTAFEEQNPEKALRLYVGDYYRQHNPAVPDGKEAFAAYVKGRSAKNWVDLVSRVFQSVEFVDWLSGVLLRYRLFHQANYHQ